MSDARPTDSQPPILITTREAALATGVPVAWLKKEVEAGRIPCLRFGRRVRVSPLAVKAALERQAAGEYADSLFGTLGTPFVLPSGDGKTIPPEVPVGVWGGSGGPRYQP